MTMNALLAWVLGAVFGAVTYRFAVVWRERWRAVGAAALGTAAMIDGAVAPGRLAARPDLARYPLVARPLPT